MQVLLRIKLASFHAFLEPKFMQPSRVEKAVRWLLLVGFILTSGMGTARSNCCCVTPLTSVIASDTKVVATKSCCQSCKTNSCDTKQCDPVKCASSDENCSAECGCSITDSAQVIYKESESPVSKVYVAASRLETVDDSASVSIVKPQVDRFDPATDAQESCSLMCTWQK